jgi:hypothetical protein
MLTVCTSMGACPGVSSVESLRLFAKTGDQAIAQGYNSNCLLKQDSETSRFCKRNFVARIYTLETPLEAMSPSMLRVVHFFRNLNRS